MQPTADERLGLMPGETHAIVNNDWMVDTYKGRVILAGPHNKPILTHLDDVLKIMVTNDYRICKSTESHGANWLEPIHKPEKAFTKFGVAFAIFDTMVAKEYIVKGTLLPVSKSYEYLITESGIKHYELEIRPNREERTTTPQSKDDKVQQPSLNVVESKKGITSRTQLLQTSKHQWVATIILNGEEELQEFKDFAKYPSLLSPVTKEKEKIIKTNKGTCYFCKTEINLPIRGRKPTKPRCSSPTCISRYNSDLKTIKEMRTAGIFIDNNY